MYLAAVVQIRYLDSEKKKELYVVSMNLEKVYGKVFREELWRIIRECGVEDYLVKGISSLYDGSRTCLMFRSEVF